MKKLPSLPLGENLLTKFEPHLTLFVENFSKRDWLSQCVFKAKKYRVSIRSNTQNARIV